MKNVFKVNEAYFLSEFSIGDSRIVKCYLTHFYIINLIIYELNTICSCCTCCEKL